MYPPSPSEVQRFFIMILLLDLHLQEERGGEMMLYFVEACLHRASFVLSIVHHAATLVYMIA